MKFLKYILVFSLVFASCKTKKDVSENRNLEHISAKSLNEKHLSANFNKKTIDAKLGVDFISKKKNLGFSLQMKIKKDEVIYLKGTKLITIFKAKITPEKVSYYSPYFKHYFEGDFSILREVLGVNVNFQQLQNLLLGQAILPLTDHEINYTSTDYKLSPKNQEGKFDVFYFVNPQHFKLNRQSLVNSSEQLDILYPKYFEKDNVLFPEEMKIITKKQNKQTQINMELKSVVFDKNFRIPFKIPSGYKKLEF